MGIGQKRAVASALALGLTGAVTAIAWADIACTGGQCDGTTAGETLTGTPEIDLIYADDGDDTLIGRGSFDELRGEEGDDKLNGGKGPDQYTFYDTLWGRDRIVADAGGRKDWLIFFFNGREPRDRPSAPGKRARGHRGRQLDPDCEGRGDRMGPSR